MYDINLLPPNLQKKFNIDVKKLLISFTITCMVTGLVGGYGLLMFKLYGTRMEMHRIDQRLNQIAPQVARVEQLKRERLEGEKKINAFRTIIDDRLTFTLILDDIAKNMPVDMWLTGISMEYREKYIPRGGFASPPGMLAGVYKNKTVDKNITGKKPDADKQNITKTPTDKKDKEKNSPPPPNVLVLQGAAHSPASVGVFVHNLARLPYFQNINVLKVFANTAGDPGQAFTIEAQLREVYRDDSKS